MKFIRICTFLGLATLPLLITGCDRDATRSPGSSGDNDARFKAAALAALTAKLNNTVDLKFTAFKSEKSPSRAMVTEVSYEAEGTITKDVYERVRSSSLFKRRYPKGGSFKMNGALYIKDGATLAVTIPEGLLCSLPLPEEFRYLVAVNQPFMDGPPPFKTEDNLTEGEKILR